MATFTGQPGQNDNFVGTSGADIFAFALTDLDAGDTLNGAGGTDTLQLAGSGMRTAAQLVGLRSIEIVTLLNGGVTLGFDDAVATLLGGALTVNGSAGDDTIDYSAVTLANRALNVVAGSGLDTLRGGAAADTFRFLIGELNGDVVAGGAGTDIIVLDGAGTLTATALANVSGVERFVLANGANAITLNAGNVAGIASGTIQIVGNAGNDTINAAALTGGVSKVDVTAGAGMDTILGSAGNDTFRFNAGELSGDQVNGAGGLDAIAITGTDDLTAADLARVSNIERITLGAGGSVTLTNAVAGQNASSLSIYGTAGNERIDAATVTLTNRGILALLGAGSDVALGGLAPDVFRFNAGELDATDVISGGGGSSPDTLTFLTPVTISAADLTGVSGIERLTFAQGTNSVVLTNALATSAASQYLTIFGNIGNDTIDGSAVTGATTRLEILAGGGIDTLTGGAGNDIFRFSVVSLDGNDAVRGGAGTDQLILTGSGAMTVAKLAGVRELESLLLSNGGITLTLDTAFMQRNGPTVTVYGSGANDVVDVSGNTDATRGIIAIADAGDDTFRGGAGADTFRFSASALTAADIVVGGAGSSTDTLQFLSAGTVVASALAGVSGIEQVVLAAGVDLTLSDGLVASSANGGLLTVLGSSGNDRVSAAAVSTVGARIDVNAGAGDDAFIGGAGNDVFRFGAPNLTGADTVAGGAGSDTLTLTAAGTTSITDNVSGIETLSLAAGGIGVTLSNAFALANAAAFAITGSAGNDTVDAAAITATAGGITFSTGAGNDRLLGGNGADVFYFSAADLTAADTIRGGEGAAIDTLRLTTAGTIALGGVASIEAIVLANGTNTLAVTSAQAGSAYGGTVTVTGGTGDDALNTTGVVNAGETVVFTPGRGSDSVTGGAGADVMQVAAAELTAADTFSGGGGVAVDRLEFLTAGAVGSTAGVSGVERVVLNAGGNTLALGDATVGSATASTLIVAGGAGDDVVDASGVTGANRLDFATGAGTDRLTGGAGSDIFRFAVAADLTGADRVDGGAGYDTLAFDTAGAVAAAQLGGTSNLEQIVLAGGSIAFDDAALANNAGTLTVLATNASDLVDASAVTNAGRGLLVSALAGNDTLRGGAGADIFQFTVASLTAADTVQGGAGAALDTLQFLTAGAITAAQMAGVAGVERILLANGTNSIVLAAAQAASADAQTLRVLGGNGDDTINGAAANAGTKLDLFAGAGSDTLLGGAGDDAFRFAIDALTSNDQVNGGDGTDTLLVTGAGTLDFTQVQTIAGIERVQFDDNAHTIVVSDQLVQAGAVTIVTGNGADTVDLTALSSGDSAVVVDTGDGADVIRFADGGSATGDLGAGDDRVEARVYRADRVVVSGGAGTDTLSLDMEYSGSNYYTMGAGVTGFEVLEVKNSSQPGYSATISANDTAGLTVSGITAGNYYYFTLGNGGQTANGNNLADTLTGGTGADTIRGFAGEDTIDGLGGADTIDAGADNDRVAYRAGAASIAGGSGTDTLVIADGGTFNLSLADQSVGDGVLVSGFEAIDGTNGYALAGIDATGTTGANTIRGTQFNDVIDGNGGADVLVGADGADRITYRGTESAIHAYYEGGYNDVGQGDTLVLRTGVVIRLANLDQTSGDTVTVNSFQNVDGSLVATALNMQGDTYGNVLTGGSGNDNIAGLDGDDVLDGGAGADVLTAGNGNDRVWYDAADTTVTAGADRDTLLLRTAGTINLAVADQGVGDTGTMSGFEDADASAATVAVTLRGRNDLQSYLTGGSAGDTITAGTGGAYIYGRGGADTLNGSANTDYFTFYSGDVVAGEVIAAGAGTDYAYVRGTVDFTGATITGLEQISADTYDPVTGTYGTQNTAITLTGAQAAGIGYIALYNPYAATALTISVASGTTVNLTNTGIYRGDADETVAINGAAGNETIIAPAVAATIHGFAGDDSLHTAVPNHFSWLEGSAVYGDAGNDRIDYGGQYEGVTTLDGGADTDTLVGTAGGYYYDVSIDLAAVDQTVGDATLVSGFENLDWSASGYALIATGTAGTNVLTGGADNDIIDGAGGADTVNGGAGDDRIVYRADATLIAGGTGADTLVVRGAATINLVAADQGVGDTGTMTGFEHVDAAASLAAVTLRGRNDVFSYLTGGSGADRITAGDAGAEITGGAGADTLTGGSGDDTFRVLAGDFVADEAIVGGAGYDTLNVHASTDFRAGTLAGLEYMSLQTLYDPALGGYPVTPITATLTGAQAAGLQAIYANSAATGTVDTVTIAVASGSTVDLGSIGWAYFGEEDQVLVNGAAGNETITGPTVRATINGNDGDDTIRLGSSGAWAEGTQVSGGQGNDRIDYGYYSTAATLDGGDGADTLVGSSNYYYTGLIVNLGAADQTSGDSTTVRGFEHVDWSASAYDLTIIGSAGANAIIASQGYDHIDGGAGRDAIDGGFGNDFVTYDGSDTSVTGGEGADWLVLTGAATIDLTAADQSVGDDGLFTSFENVDARGAATGVTVTGSDVAVSFLLGSAQADTLTAGGAGGWIIAGAGVDTVVGSDANDHVEFYAGDFAAGESVSGDGGYDTLSLAGNVDLRTGSVTGMEVLELFGGSYSFDAYGNFLYVANNDAATVALSGTQAMQFTSFFASQYSSTSAETFNVHLSAGVETDLSAISFSYFGAGDTFNVIGSAGDDRYVNGYTYGATTAIHGNAGNDTLMAGQDYWYENTSVFGDAGNDVIEYGYSTPAGVLLDGGADVDTLRLTAAPYGDVTLNLASTSDQSAGDTFTVRNFENVDATDFNYSLTAAGSAGNNVLVGGNGYDALSGGAGNDLLDGGAYGADTLTGGTGLDTFRFVVRDGFTDTITDFSSVNDTFQFEGDAFDFNGAAFDRLVADTSGRVNIAAADLIRHTATQFNSTGDVQNYLLTNGTGTVGEGAFLVGVNSSGRTMLYHTTDASGQGGDIMLVADLATTAASTIALADFTFI